MNPLGGDVVRFTFGTEDPSLVVRAVVAAIDQLCAQAEVDIALLESLELPIGETVVALVHRPIVAAGVGVADGRLAIDLEVASTASEPWPDGFLGESGDLVASFFDITTSSAPPVLRLSGALR